MRDKSKLKEKLKDAIDEKTEKRTETTRDVVPPLFKFNTTPPKEVIDGVAAGVLVELFGTLGATSQITLGEEESRLSPAESLQACLGIYTVELSQLHWWMNNCKVKTLSGKHRHLRRWVAASYKNSMHHYEILYKLNESKAATESHLDVVEAARFAIAILDEFNTILSEKSKDSERKLMAEFREAEQTFNKPEVIEALTLEQMGGIVTTTGVANA